MRWTLKKRRMWYKITGKPVWYHRHCVDYSQHEGADSLFRRGKWVTDWHCPHCSMTVDSEDYFQDRKKGEMTMEKLDPNYKKFSEETSIEAWEDDYMGTQLPLDWPDLGECVAEVDHEEKFQKQSIKDK